MHGKTVQIFIRWFCQKSADLNLHRFFKRGLSGFSRTRVPIGILGQVLSIPDLCPLSYLMQDIGPSSVSVTYLLDFQL